MSNQPASHPDEDVLAEFGSGRLDPSESSWIEQHLSECEDCCDTLLNLKDDTFTGLVRSLTPPADESTSDRSFSTSQIVTESKDDQSAPSGQVELTDGAVPDDADSHAMTMLVQSGEPAGVSELPDELREHPRYRIIEQIGKGGMGDVYRAEHRLMNRSVALKLINSQLIRHPQAVERFRREVQAAAQLTHPNIVTAFDAEQAGEVHFLVMEFVDGTELATVVNDRGPLPVAEACDYIRQAALGLQHAHEKGMVHRDIKPQNLMLSPDGQVRILDFGLAGFVTESAIIDADSTGPAAGGTTSPQLTTFGSVMGTPDYIAPEQARDAHSADIRADIYSLGCTLCFLLIARAPFAADSVVDKLKAHVEHDPPALDDLRDDVSTELADIVTRMMAKEPADRFQTPAEVAVALAPFALQELEPSVAAAKPGDRWTLRSVWASAITMLLAGVVLVVTTQGNFEVRSEVDGVRVTVSKDGKTFRVLDVNSGTSVFWLPSEEFQVDARGDVQVTLSPRNVRVTWMDRQVLQVSRAPAPPPVRKAKWQPEYGKGPIKAGDNLVNDSSLENTAPGEAYPKTWGNGNLIPKDAWRFEVVEGGRTGKRGWMIEGDGTAATVPSNRPPVDRAFRYTARAWVKVESGMARLGLLYFDKNRGYVSTSHSAATTKRGEWQRLTMIDDFAKHPDAAYVSLALIMVGPGKVVFDDLELIPFDANNLPENFEAKYAAPKHDPTMFDRWVGRWETTVEHPRVDGGQRTIKGSAVVRKIFDDRFLLWHWASDTGNDEYLRLTGFDEHIGAYRDWGADSNGLIYERNGSWNASTGTLTLHKHSPESGISETATDRFVGTDRVETLLTARLSEGQTDGETRATWTRKSGTVEGDIPVSTGPAADTNELAVLRKLAGRWKAETTLKPSVWEPDGKTEVITERSEWVLGGRALLMRGFDEDLKLLSMALMTWNPQGKTYRMVFFSPTTFGGRWSISWDEPSKAFRWRATDMPTGWIGTGFNRWVDDDTFDNQVLIKDDQGRVMMDSHQKRTRIK